MEYQLLIAGFLLGMLIGVLIMNRIYDKHSKEMQKIDVGFEEWKVQRHKQFVAELDEIDRKSRNYVVYPEQEKGLSKEEFESEQYVTNPNTIDPTKVMDEIKKKRVFSPAETNRLLRGDNLKEYNVGIEISTSDVCDAIEELQKAIKNLEDAVADMKVNTVDISKSDIDKHGR